MEEFRKDLLTAQKVDIGMIFKEMLGSDDARAYLAAENVPGPVIERLMAGTATRGDAPRPGPAAPMPEAHDLRHAFYCHPGRRRDMVRAAIVQAALAVHGPLGRDRAESLMRREGLPEDVIARVLADHGARRVR